MYASSLRPRKSAVKLFEFISILYTESHFYNDKIMIYRFLNAAPGIFFTHLSSKSLEALVAHMVIIVMGYIV